MFRVPAWEDDVTPSSGTKPKQSRNTGKLKNKKREKKDKLSNSGESLITPSHFTRAPPPSLCDSDDDNEGRKLSKKAKKRLRGKRRKQKSKLLISEGMSSLPESVSSASHLDHEGSEDGAGRQKKKKRKRKHSEEPDDYLNTDLVKVFQEAGLLSKVPTSQMGKGGDHTSAQKPQKRKTDAATPSIGRDGKGTDLPSDNKKKRKRKREADDSLASSSQKKAKESHSKNSYAMGKSNPAPDHADGSTDGACLKKKKKRNRKKSLASADSSLPGANVDQTNAFQKVKSKESLFLREQNGMKSHSLGSDKATSHQTAEGKEEKKGKKKKNSKKNKYKHLIVRNSSGAEASHPVHIVDNLNSQRKQKVSSPIQTSQDDKERVSHMNKKVKKQKKAKLMPDAHEVSSQNTEKTAGKVKKPNARKTPPAVQSTGGDPSNGQKTPVTAKGHVPFDRQRLAAMLKSSPARPGSEKVEAAKPASLKERLEAELSAAHFRYLNEKLYTCSGKEAQTLFRKDQDAFQVYHQGFQSQVARWPVNPLDVIIKEIKSRPSSLKVADFGSGDAKLARSVPNQVHSFDLVALNEHITVCDMAKVPLPDEAVHVAVFCLSLMGINLVDYLLEANRVLKKGGMLKIAEVASRLDKLNNFILDVEKLGFKFENKDVSNKMFILMNFKKKKTVTAGKGQPEITLRPCLYKKR